MDCLYFTDQTAAAKLDGDLLTLAGMRSVAQQFPIGCTSGYRVTARERPQWAYGIKILQQRAQSFLFSSQIDARRLFES